MMARGAYCTQAPFSFELPLWGLEQILRDRGHIPLNSLSSEEFTWPIKYFTERTKLPDQVRRHPCGLNFEHYRTSVKGWAGAGWAGILPKVIRTAGRHGFPGGAISPEMPEMPEMPDVGCTGGVPAVAEGMCTAAGVHSGREPVSALCGGPPLFFVGAGDAAGAGRPHYHLRMSRFIPG